MLSVLQAIKICPILLAISISILGHSNVHSISYRIVAYRAYEIDCNFLTNSVCVLFLTSFREPRVEDQLSISLDRYVFLCSIYVFFFVECFTVAKQFLIKVRQRSYRK